MASPRCGRCCRRYGVDVAGLVFAGILVAIACTNVMILYLTQVAFLEITFMAGAGMCILSILIFIWSVLNIVRTQRRYHTKFEDWNNDTDMEEYPQGAEGVDDTPYGVPQNE